MSDPNLTRLAVAVKNAVAVYTSAVGETHSELAEQRLNDTIGIELSSGWSRIPVAPYDEDLQAYVFALLATKIIAGCTDNYDRDAALRLLHAAGDAMQEHRFIESFDLPNNAPPSTPVPQRLVRATQS